jgi:hypothetical protein
MQPRIHIAFSIAFLFVVGTLAALPSHAAITVTGYAYGTEGPAIVGSTIEDFEDVSLVPGLRIRLGGIPGTPAKEWTGTLPRVWNPATATSQFTLGGPFPANTWDGTYALCNGGNGNGSTGLSGGLGNYWDFQFADSVYFVFAPAVQQVGVGLSNFQSLGGPSPITNHQLLVNGVSLGNVETLLPGWVGGVNVRNRYLVITASGPDVIQSVCIQCVTNLDGLVFDKLAIQGFVVPAESRTWGRIKAGYRE